MRNLLFVAAILAVAACGYTSRDNELIGQVKKVKSLTPLICPNRVVVDVSLGVMRNGVGSMSTQDIWLYAPTEALVAKLKAAAERGAPVKVTYDVHRFVICPENEQITTVEELK